MDFFIRDTLNHSSPLAHGLLRLRTTGGLSLKERAEVRQPVEAKNRDRETLCVEIAKANKLPQQTVPRIKRIFARSWIEQAKSGWWIQDDQGKWKRNNRSEEIA